MLGVTRWGTTGTQSAYSSTHHRCELAARDDPVMIRVQRVKHASSASWCCTLHRCRSAIRDTATTHHSTSADVCCRSAICDTATTHHSTSADVASSGTTNYSTSTTDHGSTTNHS